MGNDAQSLFEKASQLYGQGRHAEALTILDKLDREHPGTRQILFPKARCLMHLGRLDEASAICDLLIVDHRYEPAQELKKRIASLRRKAASDDWLLKPPPAPTSGAVPGNQDFLLMEVPSSSGGGLGGMDINMGAGLDPQALASLDIGESFAAPAPGPEEAAEEGSHKWGGIAVIAGGVVLVLLLLLGLPLLISKLGKGQDKVASPPPAAVAQETPAEQQPAAVEPPAETTPEEAAPAPAEPEQVVLTLINNAGGELSLRLSGPTRYEKALAPRETVEVPIEPGYYSTSFSAQGVAGPFWSGDIKSPETWTFAMETGPAGQQCTRTVYGAQLAEAGDTAGEEGGEWAEGDEWDEGDEWAEGDEYWEDDTSVLPLWLEIVIGLVFSVVMWTINLMITLKLTGNQKHDTFGQNLGDAMVSGIACGLMSTFLNCIGLFLIIRFLISNYDFGLSDFLVLIGVSLVTGLILVGLLVAVFVVIIGAAATAASAALLVPVAGVALALLA